ncbi:hypothetical protein BCEP4_1400007 [Burkholderia cepacia]|nr:hypothetical protein BCEP4_1400007 [Burkholderia cepacia]
MDADLVGWRRHRDAHVDQDRPRDEQRDRGAREHVEGIGHHGPGDHRPERCELHEGPLRRQVQLDAREAGDGKGGRVPRDAPLRGTARRQHGLHEARRHDREREGQDRLHGDVADRDVDGQGQRGVARRRGRQEDRRGRRLCAEPEGQPARHDGQRDRQRMGAGRHGRAGRARRRGSRRGRRARQPREPGQDREPGQPEVLRKAAHAFHRRRLGHAREQLPVGLQRRHEVAGARAVVPGRRGVDGPARGRRDQRLDVHHEQLPARGRLGIAAARQGQADARPARARELQGPLRRERRLPDGRADQHQAREGLTGPREEAPPAGRVPGRGRP